MPWWHELLNDGSLWFGCPALGSSPWVGPLLRWSHSCLFVECPYFVPHPSSYPTNVPLLFFSVTLPSSCVYPKHHFHSGDLGPSTFEKKVTLFVIFLAGFSLCSDIVQECMAGKQEGNCLNSILYYSVDQFQQGFRERAEGEGENRIRAPTVLFFCCCFIWILKIVIYKRAGDKAVAAACCTHSNGLDFSQDDKQLEGPNDWMCLAVIGRPLSSQIDELQWEWVGRLQIEVFCFLKEVNIVEIMLWGISCCPWARVVFRWWFESN